MVAAAAAVGFGSVSIAVDYPGAAPTSGLHADVWWRVGFHDRPLRATECALAVRA